MKNFFKGLSVFLAFVLVFGGLGFGGYKLFTINSNKAGDTTYADNVAKIYEVDVNAFDYGLQDVEGGLINGTLITSDLDEFNLSSSSACINSIYSIIDFSTIVYDDPSDDVLPLAYENLVVSASSVYDYYITFNITELNKSTLLFRIFLFKCNDSWCFFFTKNGGSGTLSSPRREHNYFSFKCLF